MRRVFIQFYLLLVGFFIAVIACLGLFYKKAIDEVSENYLGDLLATVLSLIEQDLNTSPPGQWPLILKNQQIDTDFNLQIEPLSAYQLDQDATVAFNQGDVVFIEQDAIYIQRIKNSEYLLSVGPVNYSYFFKQLQLLDLAFLSIAILLLAIPVYLWLRPLWRDVRQIESAAEAIGAGQMDTQLQLDHASAVYPIGRAMDRMTGKIAALMDQQDRLMQDIAHEIRTPLARLRYRLALLPDQQTEKQFEQDIHHIEQLVEELLFKATVDAHSASHEIKQTVHVQQWLNECVEQAKIDAPADIAWRITLHMPMNVSECRGDVHLLTRALSNLLKNAKKFAHRHIEVTFEQSADEYRLSVADDGVGIPPEQAQEVFQAFYRLDQSRNRQTGGYGLGLAIVASIAHAHQGNASVQTSQYGGACFSMTWPILPMASTLSVLTAHA